MTIAFRSVTRYSIAPLRVIEGEMAAPAERMKRMRDRRRVQGLRELRLLVPDARTESVRSRVAAEVARLRRDSELDALDWIEAVSEFGADEAR
jgi:hypothetical protein